MKRAGGKGKRGKDGLRHRRKREKIHRGWKKVRDRLSMGNGVCAVKGKKGSPERAVAVPRSAEEKSAPRKGKGNL